jgi:hypothetical protein
MLLVASLSLLQQTTRPSANPERSGLHMGASCIRRVRINRSSFVLFRGGINQPCVQAIVDAEMSHSRGGGGLR